MRATFCRPSNRHLDISEWVVSCVVRQSLSPSITQISVSVPPLSMLISLPRTSAADADVRSDASSSRAVLMTDSPFGGREEQPVHRHCAWRRSHSPLPVLLRVYSLAGSDGHSPRFLHAHLIGPRRPARYPCG